MKDVQIWSFSVTVRECRTGIDRKQNKRLEPSRCSLCYSILFLNVSCSSVECGQSNLSFFYSNSFPKNSSHVVDGNLPPLFIQLGRLFCLLVLLTGDEGAKLFVSISTLNSFLLL